MAGIHRNVGKGVNMPLNEVQLREMFKRHDTNGDGRLDKEELANAFRSMQAYVPRWRARRALYHADGNGDGYINQEEMEQLVKYALKWGYSVK